MHRAPIPNAMIRASTGADRMNENTRNSAFAKSSMLNFKLSVCVHEWCVKPCDFFVQFAVSFALVAYRWCVSHCHMLAFIACWYCLYVHILCVMCAPPNKSTLVSKHMYLHVSRGTAKRKSNKKQITTNTLPCATHTTRWIKQINKHRRLLTCNRFSCIHIVELLNIFHAQQHTTSDYIHIWTVGWNALLCARHQHMQRTTQVQRYHISIVCRVVSCQLPFGARQCKFITLDRHVLPAFTYVRLVTIKALYARSRWFASIFMHFERNFEEVRH